MVKRIGIENVEINRRIEDMSPFYESEEKEMFQKQTAVTIAKSDIKAIEPMLAMEVQKIPTLFSKGMDFLLSPKIDGIRCITKYSYGFTRSGAEIPNKYIRKRLAEMPRDYVFDGELVNCEITKNKTFAEMITGIRKGGAEVPNFKYYIFDIVDSHKVHVTRYGELKKLFDNGLMPDYCVLVEKTSINTMAEVEEYLEKYLEMGYEGIMLNNKEAYYKHGRAGKVKRELLKYKKFTDDEATIVGFRELMKNNNESVEDNFGHAKKSQSKDGKVAMEALGSFILEKDGIQFYCGSGLSESERIDLWAKRDMLIGEKVKYKYFEIGTDKAPRFPIFLEIRPKEDM